MGCRHRHPTAAPRKAPIKRPIKCDELEEQLLGAPHQSGPRSQPAARGAPPRPGPLQSWMLRAPRRDVHRRCRRGLKPTAVSPRYRPNSPHRVWMRRGRAAPSGRGPLSLRHLPSFSRTDSLREGVVHYRVRLGLQRTKRCGWARLGRFSSAAGALSAWEVGNRAFRARSCSAGCLPWTWRALGDATRPSARHKVHAAFWA